MNSRTALFLLPRRSVVRAISSCAGVVLLLSGLAARAAIDAGSLAEWRSAGGVPSLGADQTITLPPGAEMLRRVVADQASVRVVSRPYFSSKPEGWPSLEIGPASLTFVRNESGGGIVLLGDQPLPLPFAIALDDEGRSRRSIDFILSYDRGRNTATLSVDNQTFDLQASAPAASIELVLTAGSVASWTIETLSVQVTPTSESSDKAKDEKSATKPANHEADRAARLAEQASRAEERKKAFEEARLLFQAKDFARAEAVLFKPNRSKPGTLSWQLESVGKLTQMALSLRQKYDYRSALAVAQRALELLEEGDKLARSSETQKQAAVREIAAFLKEELLRDPDAARVDYEKALQLNDKSERAREGLERLDETKAKIKRLGGDRE